MYLIILSPVHPSCMNYSISLAERSRLSPWQCIDCKTCHVCSDSGDAVSIYSIKSVLCINWLFSHIHEPCRLSFEYSKYNQCMTKYIIYSVGKAARILQCIMFTKRLLNFAVPPASRHRYPVQIIFLARNIIYFILLTTL